MIDLEQEELEMLYDEGNVDISTNEGLYQIVYSTEQKKFIIQKKQANV